MHMFLTGSTVGSRKTSKSRFRSWIWNFLPKNSFFHHFWRFQKSLHLCKTLSFYLCLKLRTLFWRAPSSDTGKRWKCRFRSWILDFFPKNSFFHHFWRFRNSLHLGKTLSFDLSLKLRTWFWRGPPSETGKLRKDRLQSWILDFLPKITFFHHFWRFRKNLHLYRTLSFDLRLKSRT